MQLFPVYRTYANTLNNVSMLPGMSATRTHDYVSNLCLLIFLVLFIVFLFNKWMR